ncbi:MAG TPA: terminase [Candidatus Koribacter sp.]|jgi:hypothetical protein
MAETLEQAPAAIVVLPTNLDVDGLIWLGTHLEDFRELLEQQWLKIRDKRGRLVPLMLNKAQAEYAARCKHWNIVLKARQLGITTYVASRFFLKTITQPGTVTVQVAHDLSSAEAIFRIVHRFLENLPEPLRMGSLRTSRANVRQIVFPELDSEYRVETAADVNAGRGLTITNLHCSEVARWPRDAKETLASLRAAVPPNGEVVLESTPNGSGGCFYEEWQKATEKGYVRHFLPWWWEESYWRTAPAENLTREEEELVRMHGLTREQIAFRRELWATHGKLARQEYAEDAEQCFLASGECLFEIEVIEKRLKEVGKPTHLRDNGTYEEYVPALPGKKYVIGVDPAGGGVDGDYSAAEVIEAGTGMQVAEYCGHQTPAELALGVVVMGRRYNDALLVVERNNHGHAVIAELERLGYTNLYEKNNQLGWLTTVASRPRMIEQFAAMLRNEPEKINSKRLLEECKTFVRREDGSGAAMSGAHDDLVMAMGMACGAISD